MKSEEDDGGLILFKFLYKNINYKMTGKRDNERVRKKGCVIRCRRSMIRFNGTEKSNR
jgi:hypothetical protein